MSALRVVAPLLIALVVASCGGGGSPTTPGTNNNNNNNTGGSGGGGGGGGGGGPSSAVDVTVNDNVFTPGAATVARNGTVTWTWANASGYGTPHNVTFAGAGGSGNKTDGTYARTFAAAGTFPYECTNHPGMTGTITVP